MNVINLCYCRECGVETKTEESEFECPACGSGDVFNSREGTCDCGETVVLSGFTNECPKCGAFYNGFGQRLAPPEEWDPEDRYACFGPQ